MTTGAQQITKSAEKSPKVFFRVSMMRSNARASRRCRLGRHGGPLKYIVLPLVEGPL
jgi:hypothetical protein